MNFASKLAIVWILVLSFVAVSFASEVPRLVNYQANITDGLGNPLDTVVSMTFTIYDDSTGGAVKWSETHPAIAVTDGSFSVLLGSVIPVPDTAFADTVRYLGITVGGDPEIEPRTRLVSVPYAYTALNSGGWVDDGHVIRLETSGDSVGIGTTTPGGKLHVESHDDLAGVFTTDYYSYMPGTTVLKAEYTGTSPSGGYPDTLLTAVLGISNPESGAGVGGAFEGGYKGVEGRVLQTADDMCYGVSGFVNVTAGSSPAAFGVRGDVVSWSGQTTSGWHYGLYGSSNWGEAAYGVYGEASMATTNYGVYGWAAGGDTNWAGYFQGDVGVTGNLGVGTTSPGGKLHVESHDDLAGVFTTDYYSYFPGATVLKAEYTGTSPYGGYPDTLLTAVLGISNPGDGGGVGGAFEGGYKGVEGRVLQTDDNMY